MERPHSLSLFSQAPLSWTKLGFSMFVFLVLPGAVAYAGFFSFFSDIFVKANTQEKTINSQNIALLAGVAASDLAPKQSVSDVNTVGGSAILPDAGPGGGLADVPDGTDNHGEISIYVVREGDSFSSIANMFDVSVNTIIWANNMSRGQKLKIGETLVILPITGIQHTIKRGDTLDNIAKKYGSNVEEILSFNGIEEGALQLGELLIIPDGEIVAVQPTTRPASSKLGGTITASAGYYRAPVVNYRRTQGLHGHNGVDLGAYLGAPILVAANGEVMIARSGCVSRGCNGGYGNYVVVKHGNGTQTLYAHLLSVTVSVGDVLAQGQQLGTLGNSGRSTGPHLHFEIRGARNPF
jgi:murein DD-endopeptidase MepM/ murein hydrolase activator NlpD